MWRKRTDPVAEEERVIKDVDRSRARTMNRAVKLLAARPRSVRELRERLLEKQWTNGEIVETVLDKLKDYKYLDDEQYARDLASSKLRQKPQGPRRLRQAMSQKKLDKEVVETAVANAFETLPEAELIDQAIAKRLRLKGKPATREESRKFYDHLLRQGFGFDLIREKMAAVVSREIETDEYD